MAHNPIVKGGGPIMFAVRIKNLRQSRELNQVQLAEKLGVKKQSINEQMPEWSKKSQEELCKKADSEVIRKLKERIANRGK